MRGLEIDVKAQMTKHKGKVVENLTRREFQLLYSLAKNSPKAMSREEILSQVWRTVAVGDLVDTHLFNMRKKLPSELAERSHLVPGKGFRYFEK